MIPRQRGAVDAGVDTDVDVDVMTIDFDDLPDDRVGPAPLVRGRRSVPQRRPVWRGILPPPRDADFGTKLA